jgi:hypothetical protein
MLDGIGVARLLEIPSTSALFAEQEHDVHTTSALRYPVFVNGPNYNGPNYNGSNPHVRRTPLLTDYVLNFLGPELDAVPGALVVPLGKATTDCIELLLARGILSRERCLLDFPHPSGANARRPRDFQASKELLSAAVRRWARTF